MGSLEFDGVSKVYDGGSWAVRDLDLTVEDGEFMVLVGPSGCGKTTALRMLAGFEAITAGEIRISGMRMNDVPPRARDIAMVFQNYALYPHMNVYDNIGYGLRVRGVPRAERAVRIQRAAATLGLTDELKRKPSALSGGQRQRVAMGRAIVREPRAFLMDEPLSNLDARLRVRMRTEIARLQRELGVTTVYVTHDQVEAMTMADRVAVMRGGVLQQLDTPQRVYSDPANLFVATFIGSPAMNVVEGTIDRVDGQLRCRIGSHAIPLGDRTLAELPSLAGEVGHTLAVGIRPDGVAVSPGDGDGLRGTVVVSEELGSEVMSHIDVAATPVQHDAVVEGLADAAASATDPTQPDTARFVARLPAAVSLARGAQVTLEIDADAIHFFNLDDGTALQRTRAAGAALHMAPALA